MTEIFTINMLKTASKCLVKYDMLYNKKIRLPEYNNAAKTGSRLHSLINYYFKGQNIEKLLPLLNDDEERLWKSFLALKKATPKESEYTFLVKFDEVWLSGRMDAVFCENGKIIVVDWKTGDFKHDEDEMFQTMFYLYAASEIFIKNATVSDYSDISMVYYLLKSEKQIEIAFNEKLFSEFRNSIKKILEKIKFGSYNMCSDKHCEACEYRNICEKNIL